jgi:hypothetical protein
MGRLARCALGRLRLCVIRAHFRLLALEPPSAALCSAGRRGWARRVARPPATLFRKRRFACLCAGPKCNSEAAQALQALAATASGRPLAGWPPRALLGSARLPQAEISWLGPPPARARRLCDPPPSHRHPPRSTTRTLARIVAPAFPSAHPSHPPPFVAAARCSISFPIYPS